MGDADEGNASEISDQDDVTPPVVNNIIVPKGKSKSKEKLKTSATQKSVRKERGPQKSAPDSIKPKNDAAASIKVSSPQHPEKVKVIVRCRPISSKELTQGHVPVVIVDPKKREIEVHRHNPSSSNLANAKQNKIFTFDNVYDERASQSDLYEEVFRSLVDSVLDGFNGTIFAYGQTGTGKTYTMEGVRDNPDHQGVIPHAFKHIFSKITASPPSQTYLVRASYLEIYQEEIRDLLFRGKTTCELKESNGGVYVKDLSTNICRNFEEINEVMSKGNKNRSVGATNMNEHSSRSHAIFVITIEMSEMWADGATHIKVGKLNLVDLAGSERQGKTGSEGDRLKEAVKINLSLSALGHVIGALAEGGHSHIPYRDSKLTRLLQDSLGGNSRTIMVATIGPASFNYDETMVTLRYASRAKRIKNKPKVNEDPKDAMLKMYQDEIAKLKAQLEAKLKGQPSPRPDANIGSPNLDLLLGGVPTERPKSRRNIPTARSLSDENARFDKKLMKELAPYLSTFGLEDITDPKEILNQLQEKRKALLMDNEKNMEDKDKLVKKLEATEKRVRRAEDACSKLNNRIEWLESKVINGGKSLLDHTNEQQKEIELRKKELEDEKRAEEELRKKIAEHDLSVAELKDMVLKLETEVAHKARKLEKIRNRVVKLRETRARRGEEFVKDMNSFRSHLQKLQNEIKSTTVVMDNFVPPKMKVMIESLIRHNKADDTYTTLPITSVVFPRPDVDRMVYAPLYRKGKFARDIAVYNLFYTDENILQLTFDGPRPTTLLYTPPDTDPCISSLLQRALEDAESEVVVDCTKFSTKRRRKATAKVRLGEIITVKGDLTVRPVLSSKHRSKEIPYKDFVVVTRTVPALRLKSAAPGRSNQSQPQQNSDPDPDPEPLCIMPSQSPRTSRIQFHHDDYDHDPQSQGDIPIEVITVPEEYLRVPFTPRYKDVLGDCCPESLQPAEIQRQVYIEANRSPRPNRVVSTRELEKVLKTRRQKMIESGNPVPVPPVEPKVTGRLSQLLASINQERSSTAPNHNGSQTYRVEHPKTACPHTPLEISCTVDHPKSSRTHKQMVDASYPVEHEHPKTASLHTNSLPVEHSNPPRPLTCREISYEVESSKMPSPRSPRSNEIPSSSVCSLRASLLKDRAQKQIETPVNTEATTARRLREIDPIKSRVNNYPGTPPVPSKHGTPYAHLNPMKRPQQKTSTDIPHRVESPKTPSPRSPRSTDIPTVFHVQRTVPSTQKPIEIEPPVTEPNPVVFLGEIDPMKSRVNIYPGTPGAQPQRETSPYAHLNHMKRPTPNSSSAAAPEDQTHSHPRPARRIGSTPSMHNPDMKFGLKTDFIYKKLPPQPPVHPKFYRPLSRGTGGGGGS